MVKFDVSISIVGNFMMLHTFLVQNVILINVYLQKKARNQPKE